MLVVDDHVDSRDLMAAVLQELGVAIAEAGTGAAALDRVAKEPRPALIMPKGTTHSAFNGAGRPGIAGIALSMPT